MMRNLTLKTVERYVPLHSFKCQIRRRLLGSRPALPLASILALDLVLQLKGWAFSFQRAMKPWMRWSRARQFSKSEMARALRWRMLNHCSTWFIHEQCTGGKCSWKRGCSASQALATMLLCTRRLSSTRWTNVSSGASEWSMTSKNETNPSARLRAAFQPMTLPVRYRRPQTGSEHRPECTPVRPGLASSVLLAASPASVCEVEGSSSHRHRGRPRSVQVCECRGRK